MNRIDASLRWLAGEFSATPDEFRAQHREGSDMLLTGLRTHGFVNERDGRIGVSDAGQARLNEGESRGAA